MFEANLIFSKTGLMRFISHLDLMRLFTRAARRADLPLSLTQGFNPHPKMSFKRALKLGLESENEELTLNLKENITPQELKQNLQQQLPEGIIIKEVFLNAKRNSN